MQIGYFLLHIHECRRLHAPGQIRVIARDYGFMYIFVHNESLFQNYCNQGIMAGLSCIRVHEYVHKEVPAKVPFTASAQCAKLVFIIQDVKFLRRI